MEWPVRHDVAAGKIIGASASGRPRGKGLRLCDRLRGIEGARIVVARHRREQETAGAKLPRPGADRPYPGRRSNLGEDLENPDPPREKKRRRR